MTLWYQTDLRHETTQQVCWVDMRLDEGKVVTLKGDERKWRVEYQYPYPKTSDQLERKRWNVGGIESEIIA